MSIVAIDSGGYVARPGNATRHLPTLFTEHVEPVPISEPGAVSKKVLPFSGWHAQAEGAGMFRLTPHMAALHLAMPHNDRSCEKSSDLAGNGTSLSEHSGACGLGMTPTDTNGVEDVRKTVRKLRAELEGYDRRRARQAGWTRRFIPTGLAPLDAVLPHGGLPCGAVVEILSEAPGVGAMSLAMRIAAQFHQVDHPSISESAYARGLKPAAQRAESRRAGNGVGKPRAGAWGSDKHCILLDMFEDFYPPAAWQYGIALDRLVVLRTRNARDAFWAVDQSLRCCSVAAVIAPFTRLDERHSRRLQLAAQSSGCIGLILKPARQRVKSFAAVQMLLEGLPTSPAASPLSHVHTGESYLCRITLLAVREGTPAEPVWVDLHHEAGIGYPHPVPVDRSAAKIA